MCLMLKWAVLKHVIVKLKIRHSEIRTLKLRLTKTIDPQYRIIVEVTPRMEIMATKGMNWSTSELHGLIKGLKVEITGWLFYDAEHEDASFANDPEDQIGRSNWRGSCWEIHPVTSISLLPITAS